MTWLGPTDGPIECYICGFKANGTRRFTRIWYEKHLRPYCGCDAQINEKETAKTTAYRQRFIDEYLPFEQDRPCPKCGNPQRATEFHESHLNDGVEKWGRCIESSRCCERIVRYCGRCEYKSLEVPLDFVVEG